MMGAPYNVNGLLARSLMMGCAAPSAVPRLEQFEATDGYVGGGVQGILLL